MKIIKVEFKSESQTSIFCDIHYTTKKWFWNKERVVKVRTAKMNRYSSGRYSELPIWCDTGYDVPLMLNDTIASQMELAHQQCKSKRDEGVYSRYPLFEHMSKEHDLTLLDGELDEIISIVNQMQS